MSDLFGKYAGEDGKMDYKELRHFLREATRKEFKEEIDFNGEACRSLVTMIDVSFVNWMYSEKTVSNNQLIENNWWVGRYK